MIQLVATTAAQTEHLIPDGKFAGCVLTARRPTVADQLAYALARTPEAAGAARLRLVNGWRGANGEPSPFMDERGTPLGFSEEAFALACQEDEDFILDALVAGMKALEKAGADRGKSEPPSPPAFGDGGQPVTNTNSASSTSG